MKARKDKTTIKGPAVVCAYVSDGEGGHYRTDIPEALVKIAIWGEQQVVGHEVRPGGIDGVDVCLVIVPAPGESPDVDAIAAAIDQLITNSNGSD